jgi:hypothetical protein
MARFMKKADVITMGVTYFPSFLRSRNTAIRLGKWLDGKQADMHDGADAIIDVAQDEDDYGRTFSPTSTSTEYENLQSIAPNGFASLVVATLAQTAYIEGIRRPGVVGHIPAWETFRRNRMLSKQSAIHRTAIGMAQAYGVVVPGTDPLTGEKMSKILLRSPKQMAAFYDNDDDEWPTLAIEAKPRYGRQEGLNNVVQLGWYVTIWDAHVFHLLTVEGNGEEADKWTYLENREHGIPVPPVARCVNRLDLDGRATGEIEPVLPLLRRIDQDVFDRLITQRFGAWQVRYIAGMAKPNTKAETRAQAIRLRQEDLLVSSNEKTKFGVLPAGPLGPTIEATDADLRLLAAITQTPPHHLLGLSSNLQAEALAAAESGLQRKSFDFRTNADQFYIDLARLDAMSRGDMASALAYDHAVRWRDTESRSMTQAADALGKLAVQLKVPLEMLWEKIPGWTDDDVIRAKELIEDGTFEEMIKELMDGTAGGDQNTEQAAKPKEKPGGNGD